MARSSRGGRGGGTSIASRILLTFLALTTLAFGFALLWSHTDDGLIARARLGLPVDHAALARTLSKTLRTTLIDFGISPGAQVIHTMATGGPRGALIRWTAYVSGRASTLQLNERLTEKPELVNSDPYGDGWMVRIKITDPTEVDELLMTAEEYDEYVETESH